MDVVFFFQIVAAVFIGGLLLAGFLWAGWTATRLQKRFGLRDDELPFRIYPMLAGPLILCAFMVWLLKT